MTNSHNPSGCKKVSVDHGVTGTIPNPRRTGIRLLHYACDSSGCIRLILAISYDPGGMTVFCHAALCHMSYKYSQIISQIILVIPLL